MKKLISVFLSILLVFTVIPFAALPVLGDTVYSVDPVNGGNDATDTVFPTMKEAVEAALNDNVYSITLDSNVIITETLEITADYFTIDLNGHSITYSPDVDGTFYNKPAIHFTTTNTSASNVNFTIDTQTKTEDAAIERTDKDGTFVNNSASDYFFKIDAKNSWKLHQVALTTMHGTHNYYGDLTVDGAYKGHSNGTDTFYGNIVTSSIFSQSSGSYVVYGNIICSKYIEGTYGSSKVYGYIHTLNTDDAYASDFSASQLLGKTTFYATYNNQETETYKGYQFYSEGDVKIKIGNSNANFAYPHYVGGNLEFDVSRTTVTADSTTTFTNPIVVKGNLTGTVKMLDSLGENADGYHKTLKFSDTVTVDGSIEFDLNNFGALYFTKGIYSSCDYTIDNGATSIPSGTSPIDVKDCIFKNIPSDETLMSVSALMEKGASIRLGEYNGIRFYTTVDKDKIEQLKLDGYTIQMGTLIAPADLLENNELTFNLDKTKFVDVKYTSNNYYTDSTGFSGIVGSIVNIKENNSSWSTASGNITRKFVGRGYVKVTKDDTTVISYANYYDNDIKQNTRSLRSVSLSLQDNSSEYNSLEEAIKNKVNYWAEAQKKTLTTAITDTTDFTENTSSITLTSEKMRIGYNIGDYFDGFENYHSSPTNSYTRPDNIEDFVEYKETLWGNVPVTQKYIKYLKDSGIQAVRLPVTWSMVMEGTSDMTDREIWNSGRINEDFLDRVQEVVDLILENDMYCIINTHHDGHMGKGTDFPISFGDEENSIKFITNVWSQIGKRFKNYGSKLIFEAFNEVGDGTGSYTPTSTNQAVVSNVLKAFIKEIRSQGGNNAQRFLVCPAYCGISMWSSMPFADADTATDRLILTTHNYPSIGGIESCVSAVANNQSKLKVGCIIDEIGGIPSNADDGAFAAEVRRTSDKYNVSCFWWDNGQAEFSLVNRYFGAASGNAFGKFVGKDITAPVYSVNDIKSGSIDSSQPYYVEFKTENGTSSWAKKYIIVTSTMKATKVAKYNSRINQGYYSLYGLTSGIYTYYESDDGINYTLMGTRVARPYANIMYYDFSVYGTSYTSKMIDTNYSLTFGDGTQDLTMGNDNLFDNNTWVDGEYTTAGIIDSTTTNGLKQISLENKISVDANATYFMQTVNNHCSYSYYYIVRLYDSNDNIIKSVNVRNEALTVTASTAKISVTIATGISGTTSSTLQTALTDGTLSPKMYKMS